jgi:hypothetical protein
MGKPGTLAEEFKRRMAAREVQGDRENSAAGEWNLASEPSPPAVSVDPVPELPAEPRPVAAAEPQNKVSPEIPPQAEMVRRVFDGAIVEINGSRFTAQMIEPTRST